MRTVKIREIVIGEGIPKICVPIVEKDDDGVLSALEQILSKEPDIIEFRADIYEKLSDKDSLMKLLSTVRKLIGDVVLLFTIRTKNEGGNVMLDADEYVKLCKFACESGFIDLIDAEAFTQEGILEEICEAAHANGVYVVASNHDFEKTPSETEIVNRLYSMKDKGADIAKIAVMPKCEEDVIALLGATLKARKSDDAVPVITMSMGRMGQISRLTGELFGSAVTFASVGNVSAPGQIPIEEVKKILGLLHGN